MIIMTTPEGAARIAALCQAHGVQVCVDDLQLIVAGASGLIASNLPNLVKTYSSHPLVAAIGLYDAEHNMINLDALYDAFVPRLGTEKIPLTIPKIGTIKMGKDEIDSLMRYIKEV